MTKSLNDDEERDELKHHRSTTFAANIPLSNLLLTSRLMKYPKIKNTVTSASIQNNIQVKSDGKFKLTCNSTLSDPIKLLIISSYDENNTVPVGLV